jgi:hypothetical protein
MQVKNNITFGNSVIVDLNNPKTNKIFDTPKYLAPTDIARYFVEENKLLTGLDQFPVELDKRYCLFVDGREREMLNGYVQIGAKGKSMVDKIVAKILEDRPKIYQMTEEFVKKF